ncbi:CPA2 family monovalent cation:H+ antiporter-2 [Hoeflea halophila]|uniref:CPA2 family monovalent cation:H+ antiporter-2 n=1 Tax=Hoeflea halophila TaxID=714899 RepID=A0A286HWP8_9HYPH|nr:cation:proton antiporter [Hoeflea halophila]SOE11609.1 CPA2 family monovalent cation:H+ antiporter-2 [Hoeflea halophila]
MEDEISDAVGAVGGAVEQAVAQVVEQAGHGGHHGDAMLAIAVAVAIAALMGLGFMRLRQPPLVGFILAGLALGPTGLGVISTSENVSLLAELGVIVLLFFIGMELSIKAFVLSLKQAVIVAGGQLFASMVLAALLAFLLEASPSETLILGFIIALSSTVVAMKMLDEMGELRGASGRVAVGVLIAQDIAVVPMLILVSSLGGDGFDLGEVTFKVVVAVALLAGLLWWFGRNPKLKLPFAEAIEDNVDLLAIGSLALCFSAAALSGLAGLSPVYGAFLAGIIVGNSTLRSRVIPVIEPIQSILLVVFFLSIGLLIDFDFIFENIALVLAAALLVVGLKTALNIFLLRITGSDPKTALLAGLSMAQIGEFSFVLAAAGFASGAFGSDIYRLAIAVTAISLLVSPIWFNLMERVEDIATEGLVSYKQALAQAYEDELDGVENVVWATRARYRAVRFALYQRRARRAGGKPAPRSGSEAGPVAAEAAGPEGSEEGAGPEENRPGPPPPAINEAAAGPLHADPDQATANEPEGDAPVADSAEPKKS